MPGRNRRSRLFAVGAIVLALIAPAPVAGGGDRETETRADTTPGVTATLGVDVGSTPEDGSVAVRVVAQPVSATPVRLSLRANARGDTRLAGPDQAGPADVAPDGEIVLETRAVPGSDGRGHLEVAAEVQGTEDRPAEAVTTDVFLAVDGDAVLHSFASTDTLTLDLLGRRVERGAVTAEQADAALREILGGGAETTATGGGEVPPESGPQALARQQAAQMTLTGTVSWTDDQGNTHPVRRARVGVWDSDGDDDDEQTRLGTVMTDEAGRYTYVHPDNEDGPFQGGLDLYITVSAGLIQNATEYKPRRLTPTYYMQSSRIDNVGGSPTINLTADQPGSRDNHAAFSIRDALLYGEDYMAGLVGRPGVSAPPVFFPYRQTQYSGSTIFLERPHWIAWDVIHHEYGHHVQTTLDTRGGALAHALTANMAERNGKDDGTQIAWFEGWPTYFAVSLQRELGLSSLGITGVGDIRFQDPPKSLDVSLESMDRFLSLGEDNEVSVFRILWDVYDSSLDMRDWVGQGDNWVWNRLLGHQRLEGFWRRVVGDTATVTPSQIPYACIFADHEVAPDLISPPDAAAVTPDTPPTFRWERNGAGPHFHLDRFTVEFYTPGLGRKFATVPLRPTTGTGDEETWTPDAEGWTSILQAAPSPFVWVVKGYNASAPRTPATGDYISCPRTLTHARKEVALLIDSSASMETALAVIAERAPHLLSPLEGTGTRVAVATFTGHPEAEGAGTGDHVLAVRQPLTDDLDAVLEALSSLQPTETDHPNPAALPALAEVARGVAIGGWHPEATRNVLVVSDVAFDDPEPVTRTDSDDVVALAGGPGSAPATEPLSIHAVIIAEDAPPSGYEDLAEATRGLALATGPDAVATTAAEVLGEAADAPDRTIGGATAILPAGGSLSTAGEVGEANPIRTTVTVPVRTATAILERDATTSAVPGREALAEVDVTWGDSIVAEVFIEADPTRVGPGGAGLAVALDGRGLPRCGSRGDVDGDACFDVGGSMSRSAGERQQAASIPVTIRRARPGTLALTRPTPFSLDAACRPETAPTAFDDVPEDSPHGPAIGCLHDLGLARGAAAFRFEPSAPVSRGQLASFLDRLLAAAGVALREGPDAYRDDDTSVHEPAINRLSRAGVVRGVRDADGTPLFLPDQRVTREQMASFLVRTYALVTGADPPPAAGDVFADDDGSVHEDAINRLATLGVAGGTSVTTFAPRGLLSRAQSASFVARLLGRAVADGAVAMTVDR